MKEEAGYLAGIVVAKTVQSDSNKFGFIGGFEVPAVINYRDGFEKGLLEKLIQMQLYLLNMLTLLQMQLKVEL